MRDIKFRAKGNDEETKNRWFKGYYYRLNNTTYCFKEDYDRDPNNTKHYIVFEEMVDWGLPNRHLRADIDVNTLGQYTGLKDKNGKEIYEGDIINDGGTIYKVLYYLDGFSAKVIKTKEDEEQIPDVVYSLANFDNECRVIGNIYDNPELLEEGE